VFKNLKVCESVTSLLEILRTEVPTPTGGQHNLFRGHSDIGWELLPTIARPPFDITRSFCENLTDRSAERLLFAYFKSYAASHLASIVSQGADKENDWMRLVVAQHHGLPTRLMDWSTNPLVALFFAVENPETQCERIDGNCEYCKGGDIHDSVVHVILNTVPFSVASLARKPANKLAPLYGYDNKIGVLHPPSISPRISAQGGMFTIRKNPGIPVEPDLSISIPHEYRNKIKRELDSLGINRSTMFPDMDGLAAYLRWKCKQWSVECGIRSDAVEI